MGRKTIPTNIKKRKGTLRKGRENKNEPKPKIQIPKAPNYLKGYALDFWNIVTPELFKLKVITEQDEHALAALCKAYERWRQAEEQLETKTLTDETTNGNVIQHALVGIANKSMELLHKMLSEFGLTPASRSKIIAMRKGDENSNPWADM